MAITAVTLREIERIFEVLDRLGISREAVVVWYRELRGPAPARGLGAAVES